MIFKFSFKYFSLVMKGVSPPDLTLLGRKLKMKFFIEEKGKEMYFEGRICSYDGLTGKYGAFFPSDGTTWLM